MSELLELLHNIFDLKTKYDTFIDVQEIKEIKDYTYYDIIKCYVYNHFRNIIIFKLPIYLALK